MRLASFALSFCLVAAPALAAPEIRANTCDTHSEVVRALSIRFGEVRRDGRINGADYTLEIWSSIFGGWTALIVRRDGLTCVTTDGDLWQESPQDGDAAPTRNLPDVRDVPAAPVPAPASLGSA